MGLGYAQILSDNRDMDIKRTVLLPLGKHDRIDKDIEYNLVWMKQIDFPLFIIKNTGHNFNLDDP